LFFRNPAFALFGVSIAVSIFTLPLYLGADRLQSKQRDIVHHLQKQVNKIKAVFSGDEQYMVLSTYYKQNHYHPVYTLRSTLGLLFQIPFFIAAYTYISHLEALEGFRFFLIADLAKSDGLISGGGNALPVLMTLINCVSGAVYTKGHDLKDKIQLYGTAALFLVLLYNAPAGLVLYWTCNNIFSLFKNIAQKMKNKKIFFAALYFLICLAGILFAVKLIFHPGMFAKRIFAIVSIFALLSLPFIKYALGKALQKTKTQKSLTKIMADDTKIFIFSSIILFLLIGLVTPSSLIASSVNEFSFIENYKSPVPFILRTVLQSAGIFIFWALCLYFIFSKKIKTILTYLMILFSFFALSNAFLAANDFGFLTISLTFQDPKPFWMNYRNTALNILFLAAIVVIVYFIIIHNRKNILIGVQIICLISLSALGISNLFTIHKEFTRLAGQKTLVKETEALEPLYTFSQSGKNVVFIMLDRGMPGFLPYIFGEKPELSSSFTGWTWYPNAVSFGSHTLVGAPALYGGYDYTPLEINKNPATTLFEKHKQAHLLLPKIFSDLNYPVYINDPQFDNYNATNLGIFDDYPEMNVENIIGKYTAIWLQEHPDITGLSITNLLNNNLIRFSFSKAAPVMLRRFIYDNGNWLVTSNLTKTNKTEGALTFTAINNYVHMDFLNRLTKFDADSQVSFIELYTSLAHDSSFLQAPDYVPAQNVTDRGGGPFANDPYYHTNMAAYLLLARWFDFLKSHNVYDNTRIIIVSDHGGGRGTAYPNNIELPDGESLQVYHIVLLVKDFNSRGEEFKIDNSFMTNADAPLLALKDIAQNPHNPWTGLPLLPRKDNGANITTVEVKSSSRHGKYTYSIGGGQWLNVHDNIFEPQNWRREVQDN
jgi:YidC/Oxa1 family membrane protein insertase